MTQIYGQPVTFLGDLQGRKSGSRIRLRENADVEARLKLRVTFFCKHRHTQASTGNQKKHPKNLISISMYVALPNGPKSGRKQINEFSAVSADGCCVQMQGKLRSVWRGCRCLEGMIGCRYGSYIYTQSYIYIDWKLHLHSMVWYGMVWKLHLHPILHLHWSVNRAALHKMCLGRQQFQKI